MNVGTSGSCGWRAAPEMASARNRPERKNGSGAVTASEPIGGSPATTAEAAGPAPLCGMWTMSSFAISLKMCSPVRCGVVPVPGDTYASFIVFAISSSAGSVFAGNAELTTITLGCVAAWMMGAKSRSAS